MMPAMDVHVPRSVRLPTRAGGLSPPPEFLGMSSAPRQPRCLGTARRLGSWPTLDRLHEPYSGENAAGNLADGTPLRLGAPHRTPHELARVTWGDDATHFDATDNDATLVVRCLGTGNRPGDATRRNCPTRDPIRPAETGEPPGHAPQHLGAGGPPQLVEHTGERVPGRRAIHTSNGGHDRTQRHATNATARRRLGLETQVRHGLGRCWSLPGWTRYAAELDLPRHQGSARDTRRRAHRALPLDTCRVLIPFRERGRIKLRHVSRK
jgi:hypothetical protein